MKSNKDLNHNLENAKSQACSAPKVAEQPKYKKELTPYQKYLQTKNKNGKKYFEFYDDIKVYTHNIYDW